ncbi:MAG: Gfo/Idh/MocA family oxidoreductase [Lentisphaeria bacterium]|nr:Gfo/Idh/MocA family oxidoreductase [Lentisphaeria bacterium]
MAAKKIRVGIWGLGRAGLDMHCPELNVHSDKFEIVAGCDVLQERLDELVKKYPKAKGYLNADEFLADKKIDLVAVATPSVFHVDYDIRALEAGKYVFAEKPVALTAAGLKKLEAAAKKYPGKLFCRQNRRFEPAFNHVKEIIDSGILGDVYEIKLCRHSFGFRDDWQTLQKNGGGQLNNWGPHLIDHAIQLMGAPIKEVWSDLKQIAARGDCEDHLKAVFRGENGRVIDVEISGGIALGSPVYAVYGNRGTLICEDEQDIKLKYLKPEFKLPDSPARDVTPSRSAPWFSANKPEWIRKTIMVEPANNATMNDIYGHIYNTIRKGIPFPVKPEESFEIVRWTEKIKKQNPQFCKAKIKE